MVYCQHCGQQSNDNAEFCAQCGAALQAGVETPEVRRPAKRADPKCASHST